MFYDIPMQFKSGEFGFKELNTDKSEDSLTLDYDTEYQLLTYYVPLYDNEARIYTVPREIMPKALTAVYNDSGELEKLELDEGGRTRLIYIRYKNISESQRGVLKFVKEQADKISKEIIGKKQKLARLFVEKFYDGEAVDIAVKTATSEEMQKVIDEYDGDTTTADNSGNYSVESRIEIDREALGIMLICTNNYFQGMLFDKAAAAFEERLKSLVLKKLDKTEDFKFIAEEYD